MNPKRRKIMSNPKGDNFTNSSLLVDDKQIAIKIMML